MQLSLIVALDQHGLIGDKNGLPWRLPADLKHFKDITMGKPVIMGRLTYESIGRPLPGRRNIILSTQPDFKASGCEVFHSVEDILTTVGASDEAVIIGGAKVYKAFWSKVKRAYITLVNGSFNGDTWFPAWPLGAHWSLKNSENHPVDEKNVHSMTFMEFEKLEKF